MHCLRRYNAKASKYRELSATDWKYIVSRSIRHDIVPLLYHHFATNGMAGCIPSDIMEKLQERYLNNSWKNTRLYHEFSKVLKTLQAEGVAVIVLKGAALAEHIYQNMALRPMGDVDLLVKGRDVWKIDKVLSQSGYGSKETSVILPWRMGESVRLKMYRILPIRFSKWIHRREQKPAKWIQQIKYVSALSMYWALHVKYMNGIIDLECHPRIYEIPGINPWNRANPVTIASINTFILGSEDFLLHLCLHAHRHFLDSNPRLISWYDISCILEHYKNKLDWDYVIHAAKRNRVAGAIYQILCPVNEWLDGHVPDDVLNQLKGKDTAISIYDVLNSD